MTRCTSNQKYTLTLLLISLVITLTSCKLDPYNTRKKNLKNLGSVLPWRVFVGETYYMQIDGVYPGEVGKAIEQQYLADLAKRGQKERSCCDGKHRDKARCQIALRKVVGLKITGKHPGYGLRIERFDALQRYCLLNPNELAFNTVKEMGREVYRVNGVDDVAGVFALGERLKLHDPYSVIWQKKMKHYHGLTDGGVHLKARLLNHKLADIQWADYRSGGEAYTGSGQILGYNYLKGRKQRAIEERIRRGTPNRNGAYGGYDAVGAGGQ